MFIYDIYVLFTINILRYLDRYLLIQHFCLRGVVNVVDTIMVRMTKRRKRFINGVLIAVGIGLLVCLISHLNLLHGFHLKR